MTRGQRRSRDEEVASGLFRLMNNLIVGGSLTVEGRDKAVVSRRAADLNDIADSLEASNFLTREDRSLAVDVIRKAAADPATGDTGPFKMSFVQEPARDATARRGAKPILAKDNVRYAFFLLVVEYGVSKNRAGELIAENAGVSTESVKNALGPLTRRFCDAVLAGKARDPRIPG